MNPTISAALATEHHDELLRQAVAARRAQLARPARERRAEPVRPVVRPFLSLRGWLVRGYL